MPQTPATSPVPAAQDRLLLFVLLTALVCLVTVIILMACVPPVSRDALTHHLAVPKLYLQHGGIYEIPEIKFSYYPMNLDLLYLAALYFGNDIVPKLIHFIFALLSAWLIFAYLKRRLNAFYALWGVLILLSLPIIIKLSITVYVDLGLIFFSTAAILFLFRWIETSFSLKHLCYSGVCCGLAMGTKYNGLLVFFLLTLLVPIGYIRNCARQTGASLKATGYAAVFVSVAMIVFSPWMLRNLAWTGNPIYPLYGGLVHQVKAHAPSASPETTPRHSQRSPSPEKSAGISTKQGQNATFKQLFIRRMVYKESWWEIALIPVRIFFQGRDDDPQHFDGQLNPMLFFFPFFAFWMPRKSRDPWRGEKWMLLAFAVFYFLYAFFQAQMRIRYIAPIITPLIILSVYGLHALNQQIKTLAGAFTRNMSYSIMGLVLVVWLSFNAVYIFQLWQKVDPLSFLSGRVTRDAYLEKRLPEYPTVKYANNHLQDSAKILGLFIGNRRYYVDREILIDVGLLQKAISAASSPEAIGHYLKQRGITHILLRFDLLKRWGLTNLTHAQIGLFNGFFTAQTRPLFAKRGFGLYQCL